MTKLPAGVMREASIDVGAIEDNVRHLRRLTGSEVIAVVKADGYGHGAVRSAVAALAGGATRLGVADITEAIALRRAGIDAPIVAWLHAPGTSFAEAASLGIELGISSFEQLLAAAGAASADRPVGVHLKLETGLSRNGIAPEDQRIVFAEARTTGQHCRPSRTASRWRRHSGSPRRCATWPRRTRRSRCPRRGSAACASGSASTDSPPLRTAVRPTSDCVPP